MVHLNLIVVTDLDVSKHPFLVSGGFDRILAAGTPGSVSLAPSSHFLTVLVFRVEMWLLAVSVLFSGLCHQTGIFPAFVLGLSRAS